VDLTVIQKSDYLMESIREFRLKLKGYMTPPKSKKGGAAGPVEPPTHATVYVARTYPPWQCVVLDTLREMYSKGPVDNKEVSVALGKKDEVKKFMKKVMPFVAFTKEKVAAHGMSALDTSLPWDEREVLQQNIDVLVEMLGMEGIVLAWSEEGDDKMREECRPGTPFVTFRTEPSVKLEMVNNQPHTGVFNISCPILKDDTVNKVVNRMARVERGIKAWKNYDPKLITLYRWEDPVLGPRKMPSLTEPLKGLVLVSADELFTIDLEKQFVTLNIDGKITSLGPNVIYRIENAP
jgi:leucyl-tRNA synthetase